MPHAVRCQFHQRYTRAFFVQIFQQSQNITRKMTFVQKIRTYNVDGIDTRLASLNATRTYWGRFHQHIYAQILRT